MKFDSSESYLDMFEHFNTWFCSKIHHGLLVYATVFLYFSIMLLLESCLESLEMGQQKWYTYACKKITSKYYSYYFRHKNTKLRKNNSYIFVVISRDTTYLFFLALLSKKIVWSSIKFVVSSFTDRSRPWILKYSILGDKYSDLSTFTSSFWLCGMCTVSEVLGRAYFESPKSESWGVFGGLWDPDDFWGKSRGFGSIWSDIADSALVSSSTFIALRTELSQSGDKAYQKSRNTSQIWIFCINHALLSLPLLAL